MLKSLTIDIGSIFMPNVSHALGISELSSSLDMSIWKCLDKEWRNSKELMVLKFFPKKVMSYVSIVVRKVASFLIVLLACTSSRRMSISSFCDILIPSFLMYSALAGACKRSIPRGGEKWKKQNTTWGGTKEGGGIGGKRLV